MGCLVPALIYLLSIFLDYGSVPRPRVKGGGALEIARSQQGKDLALLFNPAFRVIPLGVRPSE